MKVIVSASMVVGSTQEEAQRLRAELDAVPSRESAAALFMGGAASTSRRSRWRRPWPMSRPRWARARSGCSSRGEASPTIAQILDRIVEYTYGGMASYRDFIDEVMPLLRTGGLSAPGPRSGSMRRRIVGHDDDRPPQRHPGAAYRETHGRDR